MTQFGSYQEAIKILEKVHAEGAALGWGRALLELAILDVKRAEAEAIKAFKLAGSPGGFEGSREEYNATIKEHEL